MRYERAVRKAMKQENIAIRQDMREYKDVVMQNKRKEPVKSDEIVSLMNVMDSPYFFVKAGVLWGGLTNSWLGYKIGKSAGEDGGDEVEKRKQKECAVKIQQIERLLRVPVDDFTRIGIENKEDD